MLLIGFVVPRGVACCGTGISSEVMIGGGLGENERIPVVELEEGRGALVGAAVLVSLGEPILPKSFLKRSVDIDAMADRNDSSPGSVA